MEIKRGELSHEGISGGSEMTIGVIGLGNMGSAMVRGLVVSEIVDHDHLIVSNRNEVDTRAKLEQFVIASGVTVAKDNLSLLTVSDMVILALKQAQLEELLKGINGTSALKEDSLVVSIAAGVETETMRRWMGRPEQPVARAMPNTPIQSGRGFTGWFISEDARVKKENQLRRVMDALGKNMQVIEEKQLHLITAISGSGPAYFYRFTEAMVKFALDAEMDEAQAREIVYETFIGSAVHADTEKEGMGELRRRITSKRGTTEQAIGVFETQDILDELVREAMTAAHDRSIAIAEEFRQR